jgi:hypothetical protein
LSEAKPLLSIVVTSRNDNHGVNLLGRMQTFVNALIDQCKQHNLHAELILVEWNPPTDRPRLAEALNWPDNPHPCDVRIIEVPEYIHRRFAHSDRLPLFQMIAKNVSIRRARGQFILATNIDILFSDELMVHFASRKLKPNVLYRIDRHDADECVPVYGSVENRLEYCRKHVIRVNRREGTIPVVTTAATQSLRSLINKWCWRAPLRLLRLLATLPQSPIYSNSAASKALAAVTHLHTTACGDFTLLDRDSWFRLQGYPELEIFSLHIDSLFCQMAHYAGIPEHILEEPMRSYHIEHGKGSGWTPEGAKELFERMRRQNIPVITDRQLIDWVHEMRGQQAPLRFNSDCWGLSEEELPETRPTWPVHAGSIA